MKVKELTAAQIFILNKDGQKYMFRRAEGEFAICSPTENPSQMIRLGLEDEVQLSTL